jgi:hypothetical protein
VGLDPADQLAGLLERRAAANGLQGVSLVPLKPLDRRLTRGPVNPDIRNLPDPLLEMGLEGRSARELPAGHRIALDVADPALVLALGARGTAHRPAAGSPNAWRRPAAVG